MEGSSTRSGQRRSSLRAPRAGRPSPPGRCGSGRCGVSHRGCLLDLGHPAFDGGVDVLVGLGSKLRTDPPPARLAGLVEGGQDGLSRSVVGQQADPGRGPRTWAFEAANVTGRRSGRRRIRLTVKASSASVGPHLRTGRATGSVRHGRSPAGHDWSSPREELLRPLGGSELLRPLRGEGPQPEGVELDEALGVGLVVGAAVVLEGGDVLVEQGVVRAASDDVDVALVELEPDSAVDNEAGCGRWRSGASPARGSTSSRCR